MATTVFELMAKLGLDSSEYEKGLDDAEGSASKFGSVLGTTLGAGATAITAFGAMTVKAGKDLVDATGDVASYGDNIDKMSQKIGISAEAYQEWDAVLQHSGASVDSLQMVMKTLSKAVETDSDAFEQLGLSVEDLHGMSNEDIFKEVIFSLQNMEEGTERTYLATQLLGRGATEFGALLNTSVEDTQAMIDTVHELGGVMSDEAVKAAASYQDQLQDMSTAFDSLKRNMVSNFLPGVTTVMDGLTQIFTGNYDEGLEKISEGVKNVTDNIVKEIPKLLEVGFEIINAIATSIIENIPTIIPAFVKLLVNIGQTVIKNLPLIVSAFMQIFSELGKELGNVLPELIPIIIETLVSIVTTLLDNIDILIDGILQLIIGIVEALPDIITALIEALPTIIESVINALITLLPLLIEGLVRLVIAIVEHLPEIIMALIEALPLIIEAILTGLGALVAPAIQLFTDLFSNIGQTLKNWGAEKKEAISNWWNDFITSAKEWFAELPYNLGYVLADTILKVVEFGKEVWNWITTELPKIIDGIVEWWAKLPERIWEWLLGVIEKVAQWVSDMIDKVKEEVPKIIDNIETFFKELPGKALEWGKDMIQGFIDGVGQMAQKAWNAVSDFAQGIADRIGFSVPKLGPLSDADEYAPDMIDLFTQGIKNNASALYNTIEDAFDFQNLMTSNVPTPSFAVAGGTGTMDASMLDMFTQAMSGVIIEVNIGDEKLDNIISTSIQRTNLVSGGR